MKISFSRVKLNLPQILFLNKEDLFDQRIKHSDVKNFFPVGSIAVIL